MTPQDLSEETDKFCQEGYAIVENRRAALPITLGFELTKWEAERRMKELQAKVSGEFYQELHVVQAALVFSLPNARQKRELECAAIEMADGDDCALKRMKDSALGGRDVMQAMGALLVLSATCAAHPAMIIQHLTGVLWTEAEAVDLLAAALLFEPLNTRLLDDLVNR